MSVRAQAWIDGHPVFTCCDGSDVIGGFSAGYITVKDTATYGGRETLVEHQEWRWVIPYLDAKATMKIKTVLSCPWCKYELPPCPPCSEPIPTGSQDEDSN